MVSLDNLNKVAFAKGYAVRFITGVNNAQSTTPEGSQGPED